MFAVVCAANLISKRGEPRPAGERTVPIGPGVILMRRYYRRLPTLRELDPSNLGQYQNQELQGLQNNFLYSLDWQNLADKHAGVVALH